MTKRLYCPWWLQRVGQRVADVAIGGSTAEPTFVPVVLFSGTVRVVMVPSSNVGTALLALITLLVTALADLPDPWSSV